MRATTASTFPVLLLCLAAPAAGGAILTVNDAGDTGVCAATCTLRGALAAAAPGDEIRFDIALNGVPFVLTGGPLLIDRDVLVVGNGQANTIIDGGGTDRVLHVTPQGVATLYDLTLRNGRSPPDQAGGAGVISDGTLNLLRVTVADNVVSPRSGCGPGDGGGGILTAGILFASEARIVDNRAGDAGPCEFAGAGGDGGGILNLGEALVTRTVIADNRAGRGGTPFPGVVTCTACSPLGGRGGHGGGVYNNGNLNIDFSTVSGNFAGDGGDGGTVVGCTLGPCITDGGDAGDGAGIYSFTLTSTNFLFNSTLSGNAGGLAGVAGGCGGAGCLPAIPAVFTQGGGMTNRFGQAYLESVTVTGNVADAAGGGLDGGNFSLHNTIVAGNFAGSSPDCSGAVQSLDYNLIGDTTGCTLQGSLGNSLLNLDPLLEGLADSGGPTPTHKPLAGSPAVDAGNCAGLQIDQRSAPRPYDEPQVVNAADGCDIGAVEVQRIISDCRSPIVAIPDDDPAGVTSVIGYGPFAVNILDLDVELFITHSYVGDLEVTLHHDLTGTEVALLSRPGSPALGPAGCPGDNVSAILNDGSSEAAEDVCDLQSPFGAIAGVFRPNEPLAQFSGEQIQQSWTLTARDLAAFDVGSLDSWCMLYSVVDAFNFAPEFDEPPFLYVVEGEAAGTDIVTRDVEGNPTTIQAAGVPPFCAFTDNGNGTARLDCLPAPGDQGDYTIDLLAYDDQLPFAQDTASLPLRVFPIDSGYFCANPVLAIPDEDPLGVINSIVSSLPPGIVTDTDVVLGIRHQWVGDLRATLEVESQSVGITLFDRPGLPAYHPVSGCDQADIDATLDDDAALAAEDSCDALPAALHGTLMPDEPLATFEGVPASSQWTLRVTDERGPFTGFLDAWCVRVDAIDPDSDFDGLPNSVDNCIFHANPSQLDTDGDGFGNRCDADLDGNCIVNPVDLGLFRTVFFSQGPNDADFNGDQVVNPIDLGILKTLFFQPPGPSGVANCTP